MNDRTVYILADGGHDYSDALRFGTLKKLNIPAAVKWDTARLYEELLEGLKDATHNDFILISHLTSHCCIATAIMVEWFGRVNFLIYRNDRYEERTLILNEDVVEDTKGIIGN